MKLTLEYKIGEVNLTPVTSVIDISDDLKVGELYNLFDDIALMIGYHEKSILKFYEDVSKDFNDEL